MTVFAFREHRLHIGTAHIDFPYPILDAKQYADRVIVVLAIPHDSKEIDNVYAVSESCKILWQIQSRDAFETPDSHTPYVGVSVLDDCIQANDFSGARYLVDPRNGAIIGRNRCGRDW